MPQDSMYEDAAMLVEIPVQIPNIFISPQEFYPELKRAVAAAAFTGAVTEIDVDQVGEREANETFYRLGKSEGVLLVKCAGSIPSRMMRVIRMFYKQELLSQDGTGASGSDRASDRFVVVLWVSPQAYLSMDEAERNSFLQPISHRFCYASGPNKRESLSVLATR